MVNSLKIVDGRVYLEKSLLSKLFDFLKVFGLNLPTPWLRVCRLNGFNEVNQKELNKFFKKHKINLIGDQKNIKIDLFNSKLRSPIDGFILGINTRVGERPQNEGILDIGSSQKMEALIEVYESDIDRVFISQNVELSSENGGFQKNLKGKVIRISPQVKQRKVLSTDPTGDADSRIIEVLVKLDQDSINTVQNYAGMKVIAKFIP